jgi:phosphotransacetylase
MQPDMRIPDVHTFEAVLAQAADKASRRRPRAALVVPSQVVTLRASLRAKRDGLIDLLIIGDRALLEKHAAEEALDISGIDILDMNQPNMAVMAAAKLAQQGELDMIVQGRVPVAEMLSDLLKNDAAFRVKDRTLSHVAVLKPAKYAKLLLLTDSAVVVAPDLKAKIDLLGNLLAVATSIGVPNPRVAVLAAVEVIYPQMAATMDAAVLSKMCERRQIKGAIVDGPLSFDIAVDMFAAHSKGITNSEVAGQADGLLAPNIEVANGVYNAMTLYGHCDIGGVIVGGRVPVAVNSRADSEQARYNSIALAVLNS